MDVGLSDMYNMELIYYNESTKVESKKCESGRRMPKHPLALLHVSR